MAAASSTAGVKASTAEDGSRVCAPVLALRRDPRSRRTPMAEITLAAMVGRPTGSRPSRRLRGEGKVPGTVYGLGGDSVSVAVDWRQLRQALTTDAGLNA